MKNINGVTFDDAMREEKRWAEREYEAVRLQRHDEAAKMHAMRWRCLDAAQRILEEGSDS